MELDHLLATFDCAACLHHPSVKARTRRHPGYLGKLTFLAVAINVKIRLMVKTHESIPAADGVPQHYSADEHVPYRAGM
eukprot:CAMPEP_0177558126 /NCGR_PEP_ID=MMETSP0369-20130122/70073_1 /TAXON_ID=447022 ORGANISM="Scrippsiella hangoei-like, Strain SHHI-4" /NCGR_SAMPLE_ID=MMETSP0369 /ASSEMBLY_ACC=CAM_ASM_000364 /LENGTH=78 /DNA_ID=CAMNT_0019044641 /DNA_START=239 /DNA_END=475 /DNA_ORIENTATION=-